MMASGREGGHDRRIRLPVELHWLAAMMPIPCRYAEQGQANPVAPAVLPPRTVGLLVCHAGGRSSDNGDVVPHVGHAGRGPGGRGGKLPFVRQMDGAAEMDPAAVGADHDGLGVEEP